MLGLRWLRVAGAVAAAAAVLARQRLARQRLEQYRLGAVRAVDGTMGWACAKGMVWAQMQSANRVRLRAALCSGAHAAVLPARARPQVCVCSKVDGGANGYDGTG